MKRFLVLMLAALCALLPMAALAEKTTVTATVPSEHTIAIICGENGSVEIDGQRYSGELSVKVPRFGALSVHARPDAGFELSKIIARSMEGVTLKGRDAILTNIHADNELWVSFCKPQADADKGGDYAALGDAWYIVFDGEYLPADYELLNMQCEHCGGSVLVSASFDANAAPERRSLIFSALQLKRLSEKRGLERLFFRNGSALAAMNIGELLDGNVQKLMAFVLMHGEEVTPEIVGRNWDEEAAPTLSDRQLSGLRFETRIIPAKQPDGGLAYEIALWLRWDGHELDISDMLPSLSVGLSAAELLNTEAIDAFSQQYALSCSKPAAEGADASFENVQLAGELMLVPDCSPECSPECSCETQCDFADRYIVTMPMDAAEPPAVAHDSHIRLEPYREYVLTAEHVGRGWYSLQRIKQGQNTAN